jgi:lanosterol synthase
MDFLGSLQRVDGSFEGEVVWCPMTLAQYVIVRTLLNRPFEPAERARIILHFRTTLRPEGGWGLHPEANSYVFVTTISYVALRLLGVPADDPLTSKALAWVHAQPSGVLSIPSWGKFWLSIVGLYEYSGLNPWPPELFLLPDWSPIHPNHLYGPTRYIYLAIGYLYGVRFRATLGPITEDLRRELYPVPYDTIDFAAHRHNLAATDLYVRPSWPVRRAWDALAAFETLRDRSPSLKARRRRALAHCVQRIRDEQLGTNYHSVSPVNVLLYVLALWANDPQDPVIAQSLDNIRYWVFDDAKDGLRVACTRSTSWDTSLAMLAVLAGPAARNHQSLLRRAYAFLLGAQLKGELVDRGPGARDPIDGGWCFTDGGDRWAVSDCTAEALSALLESDAMDVVTEAPARAPRDRLQAAAAFVLARQNSDGGFGSYERRRGSRLLELFNPSEMFGECMTELSYIECTASAVSSLCEFRDRYPDLMREQVDQAITRACDFLRRRQRADGSYPGYWGINFTYATCFVVTALRTAGILASDPVLTRAAAWLASKQRADGGWGEHYSGCLTGTYVEHAESQPTMTSWALLGLMEILGPDAEPVKRGIAWLCRWQRSDGSWPQGAVNGAFFGSAMLDYRLYPVYFPIWALNRYVGLAAGGSAG